ncbi:MAG: hypothetical protein A2804_00745 [Candidatus Pacebacteria bacterium RIFCSPHIGHO2_01_FULL_46_10]|nr:MAG: hypothetical protein A2804_00745 [Candidatus Pacebacteria bacterium RIFCSPHIGHO2_01_FULL_46_10]
MGVDGSRTEGKIALAIGCNPSEALANPHTFYIQAGKGMWGNAYRQAASTMSEEDFIEAYHKVFLEKLEFDAAYQAAAPARESIVKNRPQHRQHK